MSDPRDYPDRPFVGVGVVVLRDDRVLLVRSRKPGRRHRWTLPGGAQELGETVRETALREVREETGVEIELTELIDVIDLVRRDGRQAISFHFTLIDFAARWRAGEPRAGSDAAEARWVPLNEVDALVDWAETRRVIRQARAMR